MHLRLVPDTPPAPEAPSPPWMRRVLIAAAVYGILWGAAVVIAPGALFRWLEMTPPTHLAIWQGLGMFVGVLGVGCALASLDPITHWPITLVGLLAKLVVPIGFGVAAFRDELPWRFAATMITNDVIWWAPFVLILAAAWRDHHRLPATTRAERLPSRKRA